MTDRIDAVFSALADDTRRHVVTRLAQDGPLSPTRLAEGLPVTRQAVAKHLQALDQAGLVSSERVGREVRYRLTPAPLTEVAGWLATVGAEWDTRLDRIRRLLG